MASKFHIRPDGNVGECSAKTKCRYGQPDSMHGATAAEARANYEKIMEGELIVTDEKTTEENGFNEAEERALARQDRARDALSETIGSTEDDYEAAEEIALESFKEQFTDLDPELQSVIFGTAYDEAVTDEDVDNGTISYPTVYNEFVEYAGIVHAVRQPSEAETEHKSDEAKSVANSSNPLQAAFSALRNNSLAPQTAQEIMESVYPLAVSNLSQDARNRIFQHGYQRYSENGYGDVFQDYGNTISLVQMVKTS